MKAGIHKDEGYKPMGTAFEVLNDRGYGLTGAIYLECMECELELRTIPYAAKQALACSYKSRELSRRYIPDLLVFTVSSSN